MANGVIKSIAKDRGFGFIRESEGGDGEYFFHRSALMNAEFGELREGQRVTFEKREGAKGPRAEGVTLAA